MNSARVNQAVGQFKNGLLCSQAILTTYGPMFNVGEQQALRIARAFGGGMARLGQTCGAVSGAFIIMSLLSENVDKQAKDATYARMRKLAAEFVDRNGSVNCLELLGCDLNTADGHAYFVEQGLMKSHCTKFVRDAAEIIEEFLANKPE